MITGCLALALVILMVLSNDYLSLKINRQYKAIICTETETWKSC